MQNWLTIPHTRITVPPHLKPHMASEGTPLTEETAQISSVGYYFGRLAIYWGWHKRKLAPLAPEEIAEIVSARDATAERARVERERGWETYSESDRDVFELLAAGFALAAMVANPMEYGEELTRNVNLIYTAVKDGAKAAHDVRDDSTLAARLRVAVDEAFRGDGTRMTWMTKFITENITRHPGCESEPKWTAAITLLLLADIKADQLRCEREASAAPGDLRDQDLAGAQRALRRTVTYSFPRISYTIGMNLGIKKTFPDGTIQYLRA